MEIPAEHPVFPVDPFKGANMIGSRNCVICIFAAFCIVGVAIAIGVYSLRLAGDIARDCYAIDCASDMCVIYIKSSGNLPSSWDDLQSPYTQLEKQYSPANSFTEVQERVKIDFSLSKQKFLANPAAKFLSLSDGREVRWHGSDPESKIRSALTVKSPAIDVPRRRPQTALFIGRASSDLTRGRPTDYSGGSLSNTSRF